MVDLARRKRGAIEPASKAKRVRHEDRGPLTEYLAFTLAEESYAVRVALVREILKPPPLTPVPRASTSILGIVSVRGQLVTVIDLRRRLRLRESPVTRRTRILLVESQVEAPTPNAPASTETLGLLVDEVHQVYRLAEGEIEHAATALGGEIAGYIAGIARPIGAGEIGARKVAPLGASTTPDATLLILLDLRAVLAS